jgi:geranylgeranyl diphosphate synthase, type II
MTPLLRRFFDRHSRLVNRSLRRSLPPAALQPKIIHRAMRYSIDAGGKRLRPILVIAGAEACGSRAAKVLPTACALEMVHTYSLIHDDLPAMDDDDLRRGRPTNHKVFGDAVAILAGDALLTQAFRLIADNARVSGVSPRAVVDVVRIVSDGAGTRGMVGGQVADVESEDGRWKDSRKRILRSPRKLLEFIHLNKTAALIRASLVSGAVLGGGTRRQVAALDDYGRWIGLAFQVADDVLDRTGDKKKLGKRGSDRANEKLTYPALYGLDRSIQIGRDMVRRAHAALAPFGRRAAVLHDLADYIISRDR